MKKLKFSNAELLTTDNKNLIKGGATIVTDDLDGTRKAKRPGIVTDDVDGI